MCKAQTKEVEARMQLESEMSWGEWRSDWRRSRERWGCGRCHNRRLTQCQRVALESAQSLEFDSL